MGRSISPSSETIRKKEKISINKNVDSAANTKESSKQRSNIEKKLQTKFNRNLRIFSIVLLFLAILILLSLISYTPKDESSTEITFKELLSIFRGNAELKEKAAQTSNWLGIFGAITSNFLYNSTIGYAVLLFPLFLIAWSWSLFKRYAISAKLIKLTIGFSLLAIVFSGFIATASLIPWLFEIAKEFYGAIGIFLATAISSMIGLVGSFLLFTLLLCSAIVYLIKLLNYDYYLKIKDFFKSQTKNISEYIKKTFKETLEIFKRKAKEKQVSEQKIEEKAPAFAAAGNADIHSQSHEPYSQNHDPAWIIKKNIEFSNALGTSDSSEKTEKTNEKQNVIDSRIIDSRIDSAKELANEKPRYPEITIKRNPQLPIIEKIIVEELAEAKSDEEQERALKQKQIESLAKNEAAFDQKNISEKELKASDEKTIEGKDKLQSRAEENISEKSSSQAKQLTLTIEQTQESEISKQNDSLLTSPLSTAILDEEINYTAPSVDLLGNFDDSTYIDEEELKQNAQILQDKLETFKIIIENLAVTPGPVVTQYEFVPAAGIKISRIENLADDIAMALKAKGIRIIAPIPGKGTVGIEIPNKKPSIVSFSSIAKSNKFKNIKLNLPMALGKTISGEVFCADLTKMPHLLIAGATGSGKSVGINTIIASLIYKVHPKYLKFVIVDPKKVELKQYAQLENHFLAVSPDIDNAIITDPQEAVIALKAVCAEMDLRYDILSRVGQRNIFEYNQKVREGKFKDDTEIAHKEMPYIVVVIDELADLMLTASKEVESPIIRLAQLARAVGIHCIVATQRPSVDVITGIIKANIPARISYLVASKIDSRTILDVSGAEQLLGMGDMLFLASGSPKPIRVQNSFISTDEVEEICEFIGSQKGYSQPYMLPSLIEKNIAGADSNPDDRDVLFEEAARLIIQQQQASVSLVQRRLKVGYARAGRIIDELEAAGVIGPFDGSKARVVYMESGSELEAVL